MPLNIPTHIQGQGYADLNFIVPETVRSIRVLEGVYDPNFRFGLAVAKFRAEGFGGTDMAGPK